MRRIPAVRGPAAPSPAHALFLLLLLARALPLEVSARASSEASSSEASLEEGDNSAEAEPPEGCCVRQPRIEQLHDGVGGSVDVGHCARSCRSFSDSLTEDSLEVEGGCPGAWQCEATRTALRRETAAAAGGVRELRVVEACACRPREAPCARRPLALRVFPDSPFEATVDVGACAGRCAHGGCRAVSSRAVSVAGPNGARCVPVVESCECAAACYRVRKLEVVHDYAGEDGAPLRHPVVKEVDVGACEGACDGSHAGVGGGVGARHCADPFWRAGRPCRSWLYASRAPAASTCAPEVTSTRRYTARDGERRRVVVIESCACK